MRLQCQVLIKNRAKALSGSSKPVRSIVSIGIDKKRKSVLLVSTATNQQLLSADVVGNVDHIFDKFTSEGKVTVRLKQPEIDLFISGADGTTLASFTKVLKSLVAGLEVDKASLSSSKELRPKDFVKPTKTFSIDDRKLYPFAQPLPATIEVLETVNCKLKNFDDRILKMRHLKTLNLSNNSLCKNLDAMNFAALDQLAEIRLNNNSLVSLPDVFWINLPQSLQLLYLNNNRLSALHDSIWRLRNLRTLDVSRNELDKISWRIADVRRSLKNLNISQNRLQALPMCMSEFRLDFVDLTSNPYQAVTVERVTDGAKFESIDYLLHLASKVVFDKNLPLEDVPLTLKSIVNDQIRYCSWCKKSCSVNASRTATISAVMRHIATSFVCFSGPDSNVVPLVGTFCSTKCFNLLTKKRNRLECRL